MYQIQEGPVLLDVSAFILSLFTSDVDSHVAASGECALLLERCKTSQVHGYMTPEMATRLWKIMSLVSEAVAEKKIGLNALPQKPQVLRHLQTAQRMKAFSRSPFHLLRITSGTLENAVKLWESTGAGIEACVGVCAIREFAPSPVVVVTANDHYDELASKDVFVVKPSDVPNLQEPEVRLPS